MDWKALSFFLVCTEPWRAMWWQASRRMPLLIWSPQLWPALWHERQAAPGSLLQALVVVL